MTGNIEKYITGYIKMFQRTLVLSVEPSTPEKTDIIQDTSEIPLPLFIMISLLIGAVLCYFVPERKYSGDTPGKIIIVLWLWFYFTAFAHLLCWMFRGKISFEKLYLTSIRTFTALFVVSCFVSFVGGLLFRYSTGFSTICSTGKLGDSIVNNPFYLFFFAQFILFNIYLPLIIKRLTDSRWIKTIIIGVALSMFWILFGIIFSIGHR